MISLPMDKFEQLKSEAMCITPINEVYWKNNSIELYERYMV